MNTHTRENNSMSSYKEKLGLGECAVVKSAGCPCRGTKVSSAHLHDLSVQFQGISSRLLTFRGTRHTNVPRHTCRPNSHTHKFLSLFLFLNLHYNYDISPFSFLFSLCKLSHISLSSLLQQLLLHACMYMHIYIYL